MNWADWHIPLSAGQLTLRQGLASLAEVGARQQEIPLLIRLMENPKYSLPGVTLFHGAVDLKAHDRIHILLGRGLLTEDEAFTIGFTMGSTKRVSRTEEWLFGLIARRLYPVPYRFDDNAVRIFRDAVHLGGIVRLPAARPASISTPISTPRCRRSAPPSAWRRISSPPITASKRPATRTPPRAGGCWIEPEVSRVGSTMRNSTMGSLRRISIPKNIDSCVDKTSCRVSPSVTRCEYVPVRSPAASLRPTVTTGLTRHEVSARMR